MKQQAFPGHELRARREELGLSLEEAFERTRIPMRQIVALECGDLRAMPGPCFVSGFLKTYCQFLELDAQPYINAYHALNRPSLALFRRAHETAQPHRPAWLGDMATWTAISLFLVFMWFAYSTVVQPKSDPSDTKVNAGAVEKVHHVKPTPRNTPGF